MVGILSFIGITSIIISMINHGGSEMFEANVSNVGLTNDSKVGANNSSNLAKFMGFINQLRTGGPHCSI
jgi:hypothetical protein